MFAFPDDGAWKRFHQFFPGDDTITCVKIRDGKNRIVKVKDGKTDLNSFRQLTESHDLLYIFYILTEEVNQRK